MRTSFSLMLFLLSASGAVQQLPANVSHTSAVGVSKLFKVSAFSGVFKGLQAVDEFRPAYSRKLLQASTAEEELLRAIWQDNVPAAERLLEKGADPNHWTVEGHTPLFAAIARDNGVLVLALVDKGADINNVLKDSKTSATLGGLHVAALFGSTNAIAIVLATGTPVDQVDEVDGYSALHFCAARKHLAAAALLLDEGAAVDVRSRESLTPLHLAASIRPNVQMIKLLVSRGADVSRTHDYGQSPLFVAVFFNSVANTQQLILAGADVNAKDKVLLTPIHVAALYGNPGPLRLLVDNGADVKDEDFGWSARVLLCSCAKVFFIEDVCNVNACKNPEKLKKMERLLD